MEQLWWSLDVWAFDADNAKPRLHDLKRRIATTQEQKSVWTRLHESLEAWRLSVRPVPTFATATVMCSLLLLPLALSYLENPTEGTPTRSGSTFADSSDSGQTIAVAEPTPAGVESAQAELEAYKARMFDAALQQSKSAQQQYPNGGDSSHGFVPRANAYSAYYNSYSTQPSVMTDTAPIRRIVPIPPR